MDDKTNSTGEAQTAASSNANTGVTELQATYSEGFIDTPSLSSAINAAGLRGIADAVEGDAFVVCDLNTHGVQGCANMREAAANQQLTAECVAIGLVILVAVITGWVAVVFVDMVTRLSKPLGINRVYALFPERGGEDAR